MYNQTNQKKETTITNLELVENSFGKNTTWMDDEDVRIQRDWEKKFNNESNDRQNLILSSDDEFNPFPVNEKEIERNKIKRESSINSSQHFTSYHYHKLSILKEDIKNWISENIIINPELKVTREKTLEFQKNFLSGKNVTMEGVRSKELFVDDLQVKQLEMIWDIIEEIDIELEKTWEERINEGTIENEIDEGLQYIGLLKLEQITESVFKGVKTLHESRDVRISSSSFMENLTGTYFERLTENESL